MWFFVFAQFFVTVFAETNGMIFFSIIYATGAVSRVLIIQFKRISFQRVVVKFYWFVLQLQFEPNVLINFNELLWNSFVTIFYATGLKKSSFDFF